MAAFDRNQQAFTILDDFGSTEYQLRRIGESYRLSLLRHRLGQREPTDQSTSHYNAETGVEQDVLFTRLADGSEQADAHIYKPDKPNAGVGCRYASYLGGLPFLGFPENDFFQFLLTNQAALRIRGIDPQSRLVEAGFTYTDERRKTTGSCTVWLDVGKDWMLRRPRLGEENASRKRL